MKLSNLFPTTKEGIQAMTLEEYVGWLETDQGSEHISNILLYDDGSFDGYSHVQCHLISKAHAFLTQEFREDMLMRPKRPDSNNYEYLSDFKRDLQIHLDWKPLFAGEWRIDGSKRIWIEGKHICTNPSTPSDIIRESTKQGIKLYFLDRKI